MGTVRKDDPKGAARLEPHLMSDAARAAGLDATGGTDSATLNRGFDNERLAGLPNKAWGEGPDPYGEDINRFRQLGTAHTDAVRLNEGNANESRGLQMGALGLLRSQGTGTAPSSAGILAGRANENAARTAGLAATSAKSAGGGIVATRGAGDALAGPKGALAQNAANASERLGEISRGQTSFAAGAVGVQGQDIGAATANAQLEARNRALNEQRQQGFERMAFDTKHAQLQNVGEAQRGIRRNETAQREADAADAEAEGNRFQRKASAPLGLLQGLSDVRAKTRIRSVSMGSLSSLDRR